MVSFLLPLIAATFSLVQAAPFHKRGMAQVISQCHHDFSYSWDDGPYTEHKPISDAFTKVGGKTTFFVNGDNWSCIYDQANVDALRYSFAAGHQIASHTWSHPHLKQLSEAQIDVEIQRLDEALIKILGVRPKFLRPPYGEIDERTSSYIQSKHGKTIVLWSDDSGDSLGGSAQDSYNFYSGFAAAGPSSGPHMTLSHETQEAGYGAMRMGSVGVLANATYHLLTVADCLDSQAYEYVGQPGTRDSTWTCNGPWTPPTTTTSRVSTTSTSTTRTSTSTTTSRFTSTSTPTSTSTSTSRPTSTSTSTTAPACIATYTAVAGDTCVKIESDWHLPAGSILAANTFLNCNDIWAWTPICIPPGGTPPSTSTTRTSTSTSTSTRTTSSTTTSSTPPPSPTCVTTYVARQDDTCVKIEGQFHLPSGAIKAANSFVTCTDIWAGTPLCIPPGGTGADCTQTVSALKGDTCDKIGARNNISGYQVQLWNSFVNCNDIWEWTPICVKH